MLLWTAPRQRRTRSKYKGAFKDPKKTCPEGYKAPRSIKRAFMKAGLEERGVRRERVESECASRVLRGKEVHHRGVHSGGRCCCCVTMHTFDFGGRVEGMYDKNPYRLLNSALDSKEKEKKEGSPRRTKG